MVAHIRQQGYEIIILPLREEAELKRDVFRVKMHFRKVELFSILFRPIVAVRGFRG